MIETRSKIHDAMTQWRRDIHQHPELAYEETRTSSLIAEHLTSFGMDVHEGLATTGVVGTLKVGESSQAIGLRADMDALPMDEKNSFAHKSTHPGKMHACGHDGHCAMLLGAARYLTETQNFEGTVHFIFQPAEENEGGGQRMVQEGLFEKFPVSAVYGMHNWPGMPVGEMGMHPGPIMASSDYFEIKIIGRGCHAAMPNMGIDPLPIAAQIVSGLQSITSRNVDPLEAAVLSVTQIHGGSAWNVIPDDCTIRGTVRAFNSKVQDQIEKQIATVSQSIGQAHGAEVETNYMRKYPPTINTEAETEIAAEVASKLVGNAQVHRNLNPSMGAEDFSFMLQERPGCYVWLGNGPTEGGCMLHNPNYDFNDDALPIGANYWISLIESQLPKVG